MSIAKSGVSATIGTAQVARVLGVSHRTVLHWVATGQLEPMAKLDGQTGAYIFDRETIETFRSEGDE